jgi:hypothetical protein
MAANLGHQARNVSAVRHRAYPGLEPRETKHPPGAPLIPGFGMSGK